MLVDTLARQRIIPARAGFTWDQTASETAEGDHPRSRGVYSVFIASLISTIGSSPLARGLQTQNWTASNSGRIIPARAGFTLTKIKFVR